MIARRADWAERMTAKLDEIRERPFEWAAWDCCHFVAALVEAMTGTDPLADYRGSYASEAEAWAAVTARDGNLRAACKRVFGATIKPAFARRGDVVMLRGGMAIGICAGTHAAFVGDDGIAWKPMAECSWAFPLGWPAPDDYAAGDDADG